MTFDPRVTPANDAAISNVIKTPGFQDNPGFGRLTVGNLGMEVANELGVDPQNLAAYGLTAEKIDQYESAFHSGTRNRGR
jgi:hypothetical protein